MAWFAHSLAYGLGLWLALPSAAYALEAETEGSAGGATATATTPSLSLQRLNLSGHTVVLTVPVSLSGVYLGDIAMSIDATDRITVAAARMPDLLSAVVTPDTAAALRRALAGQASIGPTALAAQHIAVRYDPQRIELQLEMPPGLRAPQTLQVSALRRDHFGSYESPAALSAYLNLRSSFDYLERGPQSGLAPPILGLDAASRFKNIVLENEETVQPGAVGPAAQREGTRLVYDDRQDLVRWTLGDLAPVGRGFQASPQMAGISVFRSYSVLQPEMIARPTGLQGFRLNRPSTVEVWVNGRLVRRMFLDPGSYDLRDFPFTQGIDDVRVEIRDDAGQTQTLHFNLFSDQSQLAPGLSEFGVYTGLRSLLGAAGPIYSHDLELSAFYRHGLTDQWTAGVNLQGDAHLAMGGVESVVSTPVGAFAVDAAASHLGTRGSGAAAIATFQRVLEHAGGRWDSMSMSAEAWSTHFAALGALEPVNTLGAPGALGSASSLSPAGTLDPTATPVTTSPQRTGAYTDPGKTMAPTTTDLAPAASGTFIKPGSLTTLAPANPYVYRVGASYFHSFNPQFNAGIDLHYVKGRLSSCDSQVYRMIVGWQPTPTIIISAETDYESATAGMPAGPALLLSFTARLGGSATAVADYDSRERLTRLSYQTSQGEGAGALNVAGAVERSPQSVSVDASADFLASAAEMGLDHTAGFGGGDASAPTLSHTSLRYATSIAFADGAVSLGRPIYDSFAIIARQENLHGATVVVDPTPSGFTAQTTLLGTATEPNLGSYYERTIRIDAPDAAQDVDLGKGAFRVFPAYRSGYRLQAGSESSVTVVGRLLDREGTALALVAGTVTELNSAKAEPMDIFTNRDGRFGIPQAHPGRWRIRMQSDPVVTYVLDIPAGTSGIARVGELLPVAAGTQL